MTPSRSCVLSGLLVLGCGAGPAPQEAATAEPTAPQAPARQPVAGLHGVELRSRLAFEGAAVEQDLVFTCVFPERARLWTRERGSGNRRFLLYRFGDASFGLQPDETVSEAYAAGAHAHAVRHLELRRALAMWPDGFEWSGEGAVRTADLGPYGRLRAELDADGQPRRLEALDVEGGAVEAFEGLAWRAGPHDRIWPAEARLVKDGRTLFRETYADVETRLFVVDGFFLPPDRRPAAQRAAGVTAIDLEARTERRCELEARDLAGALREIDELRRAAAAELEGGPHRLSEDRILELDPDGRPVAAFLRLAEPVGAPLPGTPPPGWTRTPTRTAVSHRLKSPDGLGPGARRRLAEACPSGSRPGPWYVRLDGTDPLGGPCQAVLTLARPDR